MSKLNRAKTISLPIDPAFESYYANQKPRGKLKYSKWQTVGMKNTKKKLIKT